MRGVGAPCHLPKAPILASGSGTQGTFGDALSHPLRDVTLRKSASLGQKPKQLFGGQVLRVHGGLHCVIVNSIRRADAQLRNGVRCPPILALACFLC